MEGKYIRFKRKKVLHLDDLFEQKDKYKDVIRAEIVRQIKQNESIYFPDATEKVMSMKKFHFFLEPDNLVIYFPLYEIAPIQVEFRNFVFHIRC